MTKIFISHRKIDDPDLKGRLYYALEAHFGRGSVFMDEINIPGGEDFLEVIEENIKQAEIFILLIGPNWEGEEGFSGKILDPNDSVRKEMDYAKKLGKKIYPVLANRERTNFPKKKVFPQEHQSTAGKACGQISTKNFKTELLNLKEEIRKIAGPGVFEREIEVIIQPSRKDRLWVFLLLILAICTVYLLAAQNLKHKNKEADDRFKKEGEKLAQNAIFQAKAALKKNALELAEHWINMAGERGLSKKQVEVFRRELNSKLEKLETNRQKGLDAVRAARAAFQNGDLPTARNQLTEAEKYLGKTDEIQFLKQILENRVISGREKKADKAIATAHRAIEKKDWEQAKKSLATAEKLVGSNDPRVKALKLAVKQGQQRGGSHINKGKKAIASARKALRDKKWDLIERFLKDAGKHLGPTAPEIKQIRFDFRKLFEQEEEKERLKREAERNRDIQVLLTEFDQRLQKNKLTSPPVQNALAICRKIEELCGETRTDLRQKIVDKILAAGNRFLLQGDWKATRSCCTRAQSILPENPGARRLLTNLEARNRRFVQRQIHNLKRDVIIHFVFEKRDGFVRIADGMVLTNEGNFPLIFVSRHRDLEKYRCNLKIRPEKKTLQLSINLGKSSKVDLNWLVCEKREIDFAKINSYQWISHAGYERWLFQGRHSWKPKNTEGKRLFSKWD